MSYYTYITQINIKYNDCLLFQTLCVYAFGEIIKLKIFNVMVISYNVIHMYSKVNEDF